MIHVVQQVRLEVPIAVAWEWLSDLAWLATVNPLHRRAAFADERCRGVGARLIVDHGLPIGPRMPRIVRVTHWEEGRRIRWTDVDPTWPTYLFPHSEQFTLTPLGSEATLLTDALKGTLSPHLPFGNTFDRLAVPIIVARTIRIQCARLQRQCR